MMIIRNTRTCLISTHTGLNLLPGLNRVEDALWLAAEPSLGSLLAAKHVEILYKELSADGLKALSVAKAIAVVQETLSSKALAEYREKETRATVLAAIKTQIDLLEAKPE